LIVLENLKKKKKSKLKRLNQKQFPFLINRSMPVDRVKPKAGFYVS
jgi:hypothetical protein